MKWPSWFVVPPLGGLRARPPKGGTTNQDGRKIELTPIFASYFAGGFNVMLSLKNCARAFVQRGSVAWPMSGLSIMTFGSGCTLNAAYTVVGAHTVSMKPTP